LSLFEFGIKLFHYQKAVVKKTFLNSIKKNVIMKIAISGLAGSGKTVLAKAVHKALKERGIEVRLLTPSFKDVAAQLKISLEEYEKMAEKDFMIDILFDEKMKEQFQKEEKAILASWLAVWNVNADLKVFLYAPLEVRAKRIAERDNISISDAKSLVLERDARNRKRYLSVYGIDIYNPNDVVDIVLNSSRLNLEGEVKAILGILTTKGFL
jgi:cytidylate kinase